MKIRRTTAAALAVAAGLGISGSASAAQFLGYSQNGAGGDWYTKLGNPPGSELGHAAIFGGTYGGTWSAVGAGTLLDQISLTNGTLTATRMADATGALGQVGTNFMLDGSNAGGAGVTDQIWKDGTIEASVEAKYAGLGQTFGYRLDDNSGQTNLFSVSGSGLNASGSATIGPIPVNGGVYEWTRANDNGGTNLFSSENADNGTYNGMTKDHMVTYKVTGAGISQPTYMVFFEDLTAGDWDYNDLVIQIQVIPLPPAALMGLFGLAGAAALRRRRLS